MEDNLSIKGNSNALMIIFSFKHCKIVFSYFIEFNII